MSPLTRSSRLALLFPALFLLVILCGCGGKREASAPSFRQQQAARDGAAGSGQDTKGGGIAGGAPALPGDPGYKTP